VLVDFEAARYCKITIQASYRHERAKKRALETLMVDHVNAAAAASSEVAAPPAQFNVAHYLLAQNSHRATKAAFIDDRGMLTYGALQDRVRRMASALLASGIRREERVLLLMQDCNDWPVSFLGALYAGIVPVAVNTLLTADDYAYMLENSRAQAVLVSGALLPALVAAIARLNDGVQHDVKTVIISQPLATLQPGHVDLDTFLFAHLPLANSALTHADDPGFWLYSSGSTGRPKGTVHTQGNLYWTAELYGKAVLGLRDTDITFSAAKLFFAYGLGNALTFPLSVGATSLLMSERATPAAVFKRLTENKPTVFFGAPTGFAGMLASPDLPARERTTLRLCSSAGEALPKDLGHRFSNHFGVEIIDGIGSTEMLHVYLSNRPGDVRYGTTGKPVTGYELELRDDDGQLVHGPDALGDLYIKGPTSALLYWANRKKTRETFLGAWTKSGDKYYRDADGYYVYGGRGDDMLKISGQYVSPFEVESTLQQHSAVLEAAVIGINDENGLTLSKAFVVLKDPAQAGAAMADELKAFVKSSLAPVKYPRQIEFLTELPKTATGKIQRFRLRDSENSKEKSST
jgi:benzoate-CoA ligase